jgi:hypothetical protein
MEKVQYLDKTAIAQNIILIAVGLIPFVCVTSRNLIKDTKELMFAILILFSHS